MTVIADLDSITALSGVDVDGLEPFVQIRASSVPIDGKPGMLLTGQLDPEGARGLAMNILEAACGAEHDAALAALMVLRLAGDAQAGEKIAAILSDLRAYRTEADHAG